MSAVAGVTGGSTFEAGGVACVHQPRPHGELLIPFPEEAPGAEVLERASELGVPRVGCWVAAPDPQLHEHLRGLGFDAGWQPYWMTLRASAGSSDPRVSEVREVPEYDDYGQSLLALAGTGSHLFVAREDGGFAGHAWLHVAAGVGGIYDMFVPEARRRRGIGSALADAASAKAAALGIETLTLNAEAEEFWQALGYTDAGHGQTWWIHRA
jgi:GNAT superfamily N-acetyltransferase